MNKRSLFLIFLVVFIDLLGFGLILPLLPYFAGSLGASPLEIGLLVGSYAAAQFIGAPILGRLSDRFGRRPMLLVSITGTFVGFLLLASANSLWMLFVSRILDGITGGNISIAQAYISDVTDERNRARGLGMIGAAFGLGFMIGPAVGGTLSEFGYFVPALFAAGLSALNLGGIALWLPESLSARERAQRAQSPRPNAPFTLRALVSMMRRPLVGPLLHTRLWFGLAFATFQTIFALWAQAQLHLDARATGFVLGYVGLLSVIVQGFLVGRLSARFPEQGLIFAGTSMMAVSLTLWAFTPNLIMLLLVLAPMALAGGILNTVINSSLTRAVQPEEIGGTLGLSASLESLTRVVAPAAGGALLQSVGTWAPGAISALIMAWLSAFVWRRLILHPDANLKKITPFPVPFFDA